MRCFGLIKEILENKIIFCSSKQTFFPFCFPKHFNPNNICFIDFNAKEHTADLRQELNILEAKQSSQTLDFGNKNNPKKYLATSTY